MKPTGSALSLVIVATVGLAACEQGLGTEEMSSDSAAIVAPVAQSEVRDVERPDVFSATELALWDGRPSLGGVWVAHPDVTDPERAIIRNSTGGQTVTGALFRRERNNPGPRIQLSSDAAEALAILAGQPTELSIVVVRQEEVVVTPPPLPDETLEPTNTEVPPEGEDGIAEPDSTAIDESAVAATTAAAAVAVAPPARQGFWSRFRNSLRNKPAADIATEADTSALATADDASVPDVETDRLDPLAVAATAIAEAEAEQETAEIEEPSAGLKNPYVQIGLFTVEANADAAAASLRQAGILPEVKEDSNANGPFWRVIVGPMTTPEDQSAILAQIKGLGYRDAFLTTN